MTRPPPSFVDLLALAAQGDQTAFARLFDETVPQVFGLVLRVVRDAAVAEQVTQEVFVQAWRHAGRYDESAGTALCWLLTAAHRRAVDRVRMGDSAFDGTSAAPTTSAPAGVVTLEPAVAVAADSPVAVRVRAALTQLDPAQREVVELAYFGGYTHREVASLLGTPPGGAALMLRDALRQLRALVVAA